MTARTVLLGLDGATFTVLDPLMRNGVMPFLRTFAASGVRAELHSVIPPLTPPAWTSLMTGRRPGQHGIFDFFRKDSPRHHQIRFPNTRDIGCETLWSLVSQHGKSVTVLNFPLTLPAPQVNGNVVPGWATWRTLPVVCHPRGLYDRLKTIPGFNARELATDIALEEKVIEQCRQDEYEELISLHIRREQQWFQVLRTLIQEQPCDVTAIVFDGVDRLQHLCWRFLDPTYQPDSASPWEQQTQQRCFDYFRQMDQMIADSVGLVGSDATVMLVSDHGFGAHTSTFFINTWLQQHGYLTWLDDSAVQATEGEQLGFGRAGRHLAQVDWQRTTAYGSTPTSKGIHIMVAGRNGSTGVAPAEYEQFRETLIAELLSFRDPSSGEAVVKQVWKREDIFAGPYMELAPDLTVQLMDGGSVSILASDTAFKRVSDLSGDHRPEGIFIARGPQLQQGVALKPLSLLDIAPLTLYTLGLPVPADLDGRVPVEALTEAALQTQPIRTTTPSAPVAQLTPTDDEPVMDEEEESEILRRLQALGYIE